MTSTRHRRAFGSEAARIRIARTRVAPRSVVIALAALVAMSPSLLHGQIVWKDSASSMNAGTSWVGNVAPGTNDVAQFADSSPSTTPRLTANLSIKGIEFTSTSGAWTFGGTNGGSAEVLTIGSSGITNNSSQNQTFNGNPSTDLGLALSANATFTSNGSGALNFTSGLASFNNAGYTLTLSGTSTSSSNSIGEAITGAGGLTKDGTGTWTMGANHGYDGVTTLRAGVLSISNVANGGTASHLGDSSNAAGNLVFDGGTLRFTGSTDSTNRNFTINAGTTATIEVTNAATTLTISGGSASTTGALTKTGNGILVLSGSNAHTGATTVSAGTLRLGAANRLFDGTALSVATNAVFDLASYSETVGSLSGSGTVRLTGSGNRTFTIGGDDSSTVFSGVIEDTGSGRLSLAKAGSGTLTLSGTNTHTGVTTLGGGTLSVATIGNGGVAGNLGQATSTAGNIVFDGGALQYTGLTASTNRSFTINAGQTATIDIQNSGTNLTISGTSANTTGAFVKTGAGTLTFTGANLHTGLTTVSAGTLAYGANNVLSTGGVLVDGGTAVLAMGSGRTDTVGTVTVANGGSITGSGSTLTSTGSFEMQSGSVSANLAGSGIALNKTTSGTVTLSGANTYTGATTISAGTLAFGADNTLPVAGAVTIGASGTLDLNNYNGQIGSLSGSGIINLSTASASKTLTVGDANSTTFSGQIQNTGSGSALSLTKIGTGTLALTGTNTYTGATTITNGTLAISTIGNGGVSGGLGQASNAAANLVFNGGTLQYTGATASSDRNFTINSGQTALIDVTTAATNLTLSGGSTATNGNFTKLGAGTLTLTGTNLHTGTTTVSDGILVAGSAGALGASSGAVTVASGSTLTLDGGTSITKSGLLTLAGAGDSASTGALHSGAASGQTAQWSGNIQLGGATTITGNSGLLVIGEGNTFADTIDLQGHRLTLHVDGAPSVTPVYQPYPAYTLDSTSILINSAIHGTGGITKTGTGTVTLLPAASGGSSFTGDTIITGGKLIVDAQTNTPALESANIYIGNAGASPGTADSVILQMGQAASPPSANNIVGQWTLATNASTSNLFVYGDGLFDMNGASNGFANLTLQGGHVSGGHALYNPLLTISGGVTTLGSSRTAVIDNGNFAMSANNFNFDIAQGTTSSGIDLRIDAVVQNGVGWTGTTADTGLLKTGAGKMVLTASNTYSGVTTVSTGILNIQNAGALGQTGPSYGSTGNGTVVSSGAQLQIESVSGLTLGHLETLTLNGTGGGSGALRNVGGNNNVRSFIRIANDSRINADTGTTLTITNPNSLNATAINGTTSGKNLSLGGEGDITLNGGVGANVSNITKDGNGTVTFAGTNTYAGATNVTDGVLKVINSNGLSGTGVTVATDASLHFAQTATNANISVVGVNATINGTGHDGFGAIRNLSGVNSYGGVLALGSAALITANSGTELTISGGISSRYALTVGSTAHNGNITVSGNVIPDGAISGSLTKEGSGTLLLSGPSSTVGTVNMNAGTLTFQSSGNSNTGIVNVNAGTLNFDSTNTNTGIVTVAGGALSFGGATATTGQVILNGGTISVSGSSTVNTEEFASSIGTTLTIASGGSVIADYSTGSTAFSGAMAGGGTFEKAGAGTLVFNNSFAATNLTLVISGGTVKFDSAADLVFGTIHITGDTILDFSGSAGTSLSSASLIVDAGVEITVNNWISVANNAAQSTVWYATSTVNGGSLSGSHVFGGTPLSQISFSGYPSPSPYTTTWVDTSAPHQGWFDHEIRPTPEPSTYGAIFLSACLGLFAWRRTKRNRIAAATASSAP